MGETAHYGLYVTDDESERFVDWRTKMNGEADSNMTKIDSVLAQKADGSKTVEATLIPSDWMGETTPFIQSISVEDLGETQNGIVGLSGSATDEQREAAQKARLRTGGQDAGSLVIAAYGLKPDVEIPVSIIIFG